MMHHMPCPSGGAASVGLDAFGYVAGRYYSGYLGTFLSGSSFSSGVAKLHPIVVRKKITVSHLGIRVAATASANGLLGIWASDGVTRLPTGLPLRVSQGYFSTGTAAFVESLLVSPVTLEPGLYWLGVEVDASASFTAYSSASSFFLDMVGAASPLSSSSAGINHLSYSVADFQTADLTSLTPTYVGGVTHAAILFKVSAVF